MAARVGRPLTTFIGDGLGEGGGGDVVAPDIGIADATAFDVGASTGAASDLAGEAPGEDPADSRGGSTQRAVAPSSPSEARRRRNDLVLENRRFVERYVRRYAHRGVADDDLRQTALLALVQAAERFDPGRGVEFTTFAGATIDGSLKRYFRDRTWSVRPPRRTQEIHLRLRRADDDLAQRLGRRPTVAELAEEVGEDIDHVLEALEAGMAHNAVSSDTSGTEADAEEPGEPAWIGELDPGFVNAEARVVLARAISHLDDRERRIIHLRFVENRTQQEISDELGISQSYLSRVIRRVLASMRVELGGAAG